MKIFYLGPEGTFTHEAAMAFRTIHQLSSATLIPLASVSRVLAQVTSVASEDVGLACIPIENSIQGSVTTSWDAMGALLQPRREGKSVVEGQASAYQMLSACRLPIQQNLLTAHAVSQLVGVREVYSHPQALAQCRHWLEANLPTASLYSIDSTAQAAERVQSSARDDVAAIASFAAARHYGLHIQAANIQDNPNNITRFALFGPKDALGESRVDEDQDSPRILSVLLTGVANCPGGLSQALAPFRQADLNLRRIESRPIGTDLGTYVFYLDVEWPHLYPLSRWHEVSSVLADMGTVVTVLGIYPEWDGTTVGTPAAKG